MTKQELKEKIENLFANEQMVMDLIKQPSIKDAKEFLAKNEINLGDEEMIYFKKYLKKAMEKGSKLTEEDLKEVSEELTDEELNSVSGGWTVARIISKPGEVMMHTLVECIGAPIIGIKRGIESLKEKWEDIEDDDSWIK